jgi:hypothetical protein
MQLTHITNLNTYTPIIFNLLERVDVEISGIVLEEIRLTLEKRFLWTVMSAFEPENLFLWVEKLPLWMEKQFL